MQSGARKDFSYLMANKEEDLRGVLEFSKILSIAPKAKQEFLIEYEERTFRLKASNTEDRDTWVNALTFLHE